MELNPKQTKAALLLARGDTVTATAKQVGVNRITIHQWLKEDDNFNAYLNSLKRELVDAGRSAMISAEKSHIENFTEKKIKKINAKTKQGLKKTVLKWTVFKSEDSNTHPTHGQNVLAYDSVGESRVCRFNAKVDPKYNPFLISTFKTDNSHSFYIFAGELKRGDHKFKVCYDDIDMLSDEIDIVINKLEQELYKHVMSHRPYFANVIAWMPLPNAPRNEVEIDDEYLIEQTTLETFDIIDAITPALREAVKHLLVQQGVSK
jgi:phage terminase small subunit